MTLFLLLVMFFSLASLKVSRSQAFTESLQTKIHMAVNKKLFYYL